MLTKFTFLLVVGVAMAMAIEFKLVPCGDDGGVALGFQCDQLPFDLNPKYFPYLETVLDDDDQCWIIRKSDSNANSPVAHAMDG